MDAPTNHPPALVTPLPASVRAQPLADTGLILVGGTFDPPHVAHTQLPDAARRSIGAENAWLVFVPAGVSPFKVGGEGAVGGASALDRLAMLGLAIADLPRAGIWTDEIDRGDSPSYWIDTLLRLRSLIGPAVKLWFVLGTDQVAQFHRWRRCEEILELAEPLVLPREPIASAAAMEAALRVPGVWQDERIAWWLKRRIGLPVMGVSATRIRAQAANASGSGLLADVDPDVLAYIREHRLYGMGLRG